MAARDEFLALFRSAMAPGGAMAPLEQFVKSRSFPDLLECVGAYFDAFEPYGRKNDRSLAVFSLLATRAVDKGDVYFALRVRVLCRSTDRAWHERFAASTPRQQQALDAAIARKKNSLSPTQRKFLQLYDEHMAGKPRRQQEIEKLTSSLQLAKRDVELQSCLRAYIEMSQGYKDANGPRSILIFFGTSHAAIAGSTPHFAAVYSKNIADNRVWKARYDAMDGRQRAFIDDDLRKKKTIYKDVEYKGKTYREPAGTYQPGHVAADKEAPAETLAVKTTTAAQKELVTAVRAVRSRRGRFQMDPLHDFLRRTGGPALQDCLDFYLQALQNKAEPNDSVSLTVFYALLTTAIAKSEAYFAYKTRALIDNPGTLVAVRHEQLSEYRRGEVRKEIEKKEAGARFVDELKFAYFSAHQTDPADHAALAAFEPAYDAEQLSLLSKATSDFEVAAAVRDVEAASKAFDAIADVLRAQKDRLLLYSLIRRSRERKALPVELRHLIYMYGIGLLHQRAINWHPVVYKRGFNEEEKQLLIGPDIAGDRYFNDYALTLEYALWKRLGDAAIGDGCKALAALHLFGARRNMRLVPMTEAAQITSVAETLWQKQADALQAVRIPVKSRWDTGKTLRLGQTLVDAVFIVWWDSARTIAYVQLKDTKEVIFELDSFTTLGELADADAFYAEVFRNTRHLLVLLPILFEILGYIPDLVTGGLSGLVKSIAFNLALSHSIEVLGIDPNIAQIALLGVSLAAHAVGPKEHAGMVDADPSAVQQKSMTRYTENPAIAEKATDAPHTTPDGAGMGASPPFRGTLADEIDMRGVRTGEGGIVIRGDDTPGGSGTANAAIDAPMTQRVLDRALPADASPGGVTPLRTPKTLQAELRPKVESAERALDQLQHSIASTRDEIEATKAALANPDAKRPLSDRARAAMEERLKKREADLPNLERIEAQQQLALVALRAELEAADNAVQALSPKVLGEFNLPDKPVTFRAGGVEVESWRRDAFVPTGQNRKDLARVLNAQPNGDLSRALLRNGQLLPAAGGNTAHWEANPNIIEMAHVLSKTEGERHVCIVMSKARNQRIGGDFERTGVLFRDEAIVIQGVAVDRLTALDLVKAKLLPASAVDKAPVIHFAK